MVLVSLGRRDETLIQIIPLLGNEYLSFSCQGLSIGAEERSETDKKRDLRKKKKRQSEKQKVKEQSERAAQRANPGLGKVYRKPKFRR